MMPLPPSDWRTSGCALLLPPVMMLAALFGMWADLTLGTGGRVTAVAVVLVFALALFGLRKAAELAPAGQSPEVWILAQLILAVQRLARRLASGRPGHSDARPAAYVPDVPATPVIEFVDLFNPARRPELRLEDLKPPLLITGSPGTGKTTLLRAIACAAMAEPERTGGQQLHTVTFDANRELAEFVADRSRRHGRRTIVIDLGADDYLVPIQFPRSAAAGGSAAAAAMRAVWFPFQAEVPSQMVDTLSHGFRLLQAAGYGLGQFLRLFLSPRFMDEVLRRGEAVIDAHMREWVAKIKEMNPNEWHDKFLPSFARVFMLLESEATRLTLGSLGEGFCFDRLMAPGDQGTGIDVIVTAQGSVNEEAVYFTFGLLLADLATGLRTRLHARRAGRYPEIVILADEFGKYGGAEGIVNLFSTARNADVKLVAATHSLLSFQKGQLREMIRNLAVNRVAGGETGEGAPLTAQDLGPYDPAAVATRGADGHATSHWSPEAQKAAFVERLRNARRFEFALRFGDIRPACWGRFNPGAGLFPADSELERAMAEARRESGVPVAELRARIDRENAHLDERFGPVGYWPDEPPPGRGDTGGDDRPDNSFRPSFWS